MRGDEGGDALLPPDWPVVLPEIHLGVCRLLQRLLQVGGPPQRIAHLGPAHREQVVHRLREILGAPVRLARRDGEGELRGRLGPWNVVEDEAHSIELQVLRRLFDQHRRLQDPHLPVHDPFPKPRVDQSGRRALEVAAELVGRAPSHRRSHQDVLAGRFLHEPFGRDDGDRPPLRLIGADDAEGAAEVIGVGVREDQRGDRPVAKLLAREGHRRGRALSAGEGIDHDPPGCPLDQRDVGDIEAAQLVDAVGHLEQPDLRVEYRVPPEAGVHGRRCLTFHEREGIEVLEHRAVVRDELARRTRH